MCLMLGKSMLVIFLSLTVFYRMLIASIIGAFCL